MHTGTLIRGLIEMTERVERGMTQSNNSGRHTCAWDRDRARLRKFHWLPNDTLCEGCYLPLGSHAHTDLSCPNPSDFGPLFCATRFSPALCQWEELSAGADTSTTTAMVCEAGMVVVELADNGSAGAGMGYCAVHFAKAQAMYAQEDQA